MKKKDIFSKLCFGVVALLAFVACDKNEGGPTPDPEPAVKEGVYFLMEGNANSGQNGQIYFMAPNSTQLPIFATAGDVYEACNPGHQAGALLEDMYIADGKMYLLSQKGAVHGGDGQIVILNAETLKIEQVIEAVDLGEDNHPQHIVVANNKIYMQYAVSPYETHSGIRVFDLTSRQLAAADIDGTYGEFSKSGAAKARMLVSRNRIYASCGESLVIIDPSTDQIVKRVSFEGRQVKDVVKGKDGNLYLAVSGTFEMSGIEATYTSKSKIVKMDHSGNILSETEIGVDFPVMTYTSNVAMCASLNEDALYFAGEYDTDYYRTDSICRYDYTTGTLKKVSIENTTENFNGLSGYMAVDPWTNRLIVPIMGNVFATYNTTTMGLVEYDDDNRTPVSFCAGIYSTEQFKTAYLSK